MLRELVGNRSPSSLALRRVFVGLQRELLGLLRRLRDLVGVVLVGADLRVAAAPSGIIESISGGTSPVTRRASPMRRMPVPNQLTSTSRSSSSHFA